MSSYCYAQKCTHLQSQKPVAAHSQSKQIQYFGFLWRSTQVYFMPSLCNHYDRLTRKVLCLIWTGEHITTFRVERVYLDLSVSQLAKKWRCHSTEWLMHTLSALRGGGCYKNILSLSINTPILVGTKHLHNIYTMLGQRLRRWPNII